jgi:sec-independent protein translocase protein TatA
MGDLATGIKSFKKNMKEDEPDASMAAAEPGKSSGTIQGPAGASTTAGTAQTTSRPAA